MRLALLLLSSVFAGVSYLVYIVAILRGEARPHRTTRFCTALITVLAFSSLLAQHSTVAIWLSVIFAIGSILIFLLSIWRGMGGWSTVDVVCLLTSALGMVFWKMTANPLYGLIFFIGSDFVAQVPMLIKTYRFPETEVWTFYFLDVLASLCTLAALEHWSMGELVYPLYVVVLDTSIISLILRVPIARKWGFMR